MDGKSKEDITNTIKYSIGDMVGYLNREDKKKYKEYIDELSHDEKVLKHVEDKIEKTTSYLNLTEAQKYQITKAALRFLAIGLVYYTTSHLTSNTGHFYIVTDNILSQLLSNVLG